MIRVTGIDHRVHGRIDAARIGGLAIAVTLVGHYAWELAQARQFMEHAGAAISEYAWHCFRAALGDAVIAAASYGLVALLFRRVRWPLHSPVLAPAIAWITIGLAITIAIEQWAIASGRWSYAPAMPTVLGVGALPLAQWVIVPSVTLLTFRAIVRRLG